MDVALLGASGDCGREIASQMVAARLLTTHERLQLVGRANGASARILHGLASDLTDAHAESVPDLDVALSPEEVVADIWVVAAGQTPPTDGGMVDRQALARNNAQVFATYAEALAKHGQGTEIVIVVSNPVELGVALFARAIGRERVIGIGAYQDSLRFRREIATDLGIRRQRVAAFMLGEHGDNQLPIWSGVRVQGMDREELGRAITAMRRGTENDDLLVACRQHRLDLVDCVRDGRVAEAFQRVDQLPPDQRVVIKPFITHLSGAKTITATANVTVDLLQMLLNGHEVQIAGQVVLEPGEFYGLTGPLGVPIIVGPGGVRRVVEIPLTSQEQAQMTHIATDVNDKVTGWIADLGAA